MDIIFLHDLKVETVIGIWEWERKIRQTVAIDLDMSADIRKAAASDSVDDTLNYKLVAKRVQQFVADSSFQLVETLAEKDCGNRAWRIRGVLGSRQGEQARGDTRCPRRRRSH